MQQLMATGDTSPMAIRAAKDAALRFYPREEPAPVEVVLFHDVLCSWCYVADARLESLRDEYGDALNWSLRPYPLRPESQLPGKKERQILARHYRRIAKESEGKGVKPDLWIGEDPPVSSLPPLVALEAAHRQGPAAQRELLRAMRRAAFVEGINVARRDVLVELASRAGVDLHEFVEALDDGSLAESVTESAEEAESLGIHGVPALVIGGEWLMQGCRDASEYRHVIDKYLRERRSGPPVRTIH
ncbi:MAG: DsbA family protein [Myxococcales bacterium]